MGKPSEKPQLSSGALKVSLPDGSGGVSGGGVGGGSRGRGQATHFSAHSPSSVHRRLPAAMEGPDSLSWSKDSRITLTGLYVFMDSTMGSLILSLLIAAIILSPILFTHDVFGGSMTDMMALQFPQRAFVSYWIKRGIWPLWNHSIFNGSPFQTGSHSLAYFTTLFQWLFPVAVEIKVTIWVHVALGIFFMRGLLKHEFGHHSLGALFGGVAFAATGFSIAHLFAGHVDIAVTFVYLPAVCWALCAALRSPGLRATTIAAAVFSLMVQSGHIHMVYITVLALASFLLLRAVMGPAVGTASVLSSASTSAPPFASTSPFSCLTSFLGDACAPAPFFDVSRDLAITVNGNNSSSGDKSSPSLSSSKPSSLPRDLVQLVVKGAVIGCVSLLFCAFQLYPYAETVAHSQRSTIKNYDFAVSEAAHPLDWLRVIAPHAFGGNQPHNPFWASWTPWEGLAYVGVSTLVLAGAALGAMRWKDRLVFTSLLAIFGLLAAGPSTAFFELWFHVDPLLWRFRAPGRFVLATTFFLAWLGSHGLSLLLHHARSSTAASVSLRRGAACGAGLVVVAVGFVYSIVRWTLDGTTNAQGASSGWHVLKSMNVFNDDTIKNGISPLWPSEQVGGALVRGLHKELFLGLVIAALTLILVLLLVLPLDSVFAFLKRTVAPTWLVRQLDSKRSRGPSIAFPFLVGLALLTVLVVEAGVFAHPYLTTIPEERLHLSPQSTARLEKRLPAGGRYVALNQVHLNKAGGYGFSELSGYDTFVSRAFVAACNVAQRTNREMGWSLISGCCSHDMCRSFGVSQIVSHTGEVEELTPTPNPRLYVTRSVTSLNGPRGDPSTARPAWTTVANDPAKLLATTYLFADDVIDAQSFLAEKGLAHGGSLPEKDAVKITSMTPNTVVMSVSLTKPGVVVLTDSPMPGWSAASSSAGPLALLSANGDLHRALLVPAGTHTITMTYWPRRLTVGLAVSLSAYVLWVVYLWSSAGATATAGGRNKYE